MLWNSSTHTNTDIASANNGTSSFWDIYGHLCMYISTVTDCDLFADVLPVRVKRQITEHVQPYTHRSRVKSLLDSSDPNHALLGFACVCDLGSPAHFNQVTAIMLPAVRTLPFQRVEFCIIYCWVSLEQLVVLQSSLPTFDSKDLVDTWNRFMCSQPDKCCCVEIRPQEFVWYQWRGVPFVVA